MAEHRLATEFSLRLELEDAIERLIDMLDTMDPDPDLEPSLGWNGCMQFEPLLAVDLEGDCEDEGAQCDDEGVWI